MKNIFDCNNYQHSYRLFRWGVRFLRQAQEPSFYDSGTPYTVAELVEATSQIALRQAQEPSFYDSGALYTVAELVEATFQIGVRFPSINSGTVLLRFRHSSTVAEPVEATSQIALR